MNQTTIIRDRAAIYGAPMAQLLATYNAMTGESVKRFSSQAVAESRTDRALMAAEDAAAHLGVKPGAKPVAMTVAEVAAARAAKGLEPAPGSASEERPATKDPAAPTEPTKTTRTTPPPANPAPRVVRHLLEPSDAKAVAEPGDAPATDGEENPFKPGTLGHGLWVATNSKEAREKRAPAASGTRGGSAQKFTTVRATWAGKTKLQAASRRAAVLAALQSACELQLKGLGLAATAENAKQAPGISIDLLGAAFPGEESLRGFIQKLVVCGHAEVVS